MVSEKTGGVRMRVTIAIDRWLWRPVDGVLLICVSSMLIAVSTQVFARTYNFSTPWTEELSRFLFIWTAFLGLSVGFRKLHHPRIMLLVNILPPIFRRVSVHIYALTGMIFFSVVGWYSLKLVYRQIRIGEVSPVLGIGMYIITIPAVISAVLSVIALIQTVYLDKASRSQLEDTDRVIT